MNQLLSTTPTTTQINSLCLQAKSLITSSPDKAMASAEKAWLIARSNKDEAMLAQSHECLASCYMEVRDLDSAETHAKKAHEYAIQNDQYIIAGDSANQLARLAYQRSDVFETFTYFKEAADAFALAGAMARQGSATGNLGLTFGYLYDFEEASHYLFKAIKLLEQDETSDPMILIRHSFNLGMILYRMKAYEEAIDRLDQAFALAVKHGAKKIRYCIMGYSAASHAKLSQIERATQKANIVLAIDEENVNSDALATAHLALGLSNALIGEYDAAVEHLIATDQHAARISNKMVMCDALEKLSEIYALIEEPGLAYNYNAKFVSLYREITEEGRSKQATALKVRFEAERKEREARLFKQKNEELGKMYAELERIYEHDREMMGIVSHDLRNPLQAILSYIELASAKATSLGVQNELSRYLGRAYQSTEYAVEIVKNMLTVDRLDSGVLLLAIDPINIREIVELVCNRQSVTADTKDIRITLQFSLCDGIGLADHGSLQQVISNTLSNAIKFSPTNSTITVTLHECAKTIRIAIQDQGQGLTESDKVKLFKKYETLSAKPTGGEQSTGLGLFICNHLMKAMGGSISAESEGKGKGATFIITIPKAPTA